MSYNILMITDTTGNRIAANSAELSVLAEQLSPSSGGRKCFLICGREIAERAGAFSAQTGFHAYVADSRGFRYPNPALTADVVVNLIEETPFDYVCFLHTAAGCQAAAVTAAKTGAVCISAVNDMRIQENRDIIFQRALFNGKMVMETRPVNRPVVLTVLPGAFSYDPNDKGQSAQPDITSIKVEGTSDGYQPLEITSADDTDAAIDKADIIIAAGRGIGSEENLELVNRMARLFPNAAVAASRPLCDLKWLPYSRQVGATGKTVAPKLYLACGISGAQQHLYGMKDSQCIVAVNTDSNAAIFSVADFCIVADVTAFLPTLADMYEKQRNNQSDT